MKKKKIAMLLVLAAALSGCSTFQEPTQPLPTEPLPVIAVHEMTNLPAALDPLAEETGEIALIRSFLSGKLYRVSADGEFIPEMAAALPEDVTSEFSGNALYGIPAEAVRGYAFRVDLSEDPCWEDGTPITAEDYVLTLTGLLQNEAFRAQFADIANAEAFLEGACLPGTDIVSLADSGITSVSEAMELGITEFYVDAGTFWGLDAQWLSIDDTTRLRDYAMPAGLDEQFVSAAWLYRTYLQEGTPYDYLQSEFVGIPAQPGEEITLEHVGILKTGDYQLTFIFNRPTTPDALAAALMKLELTSGENASYGPYCVVSMDSGLIELARNENWWGDEVYEADIIRFRKAG